MSADVVAQLREAQAALARVRQLADAWETRGFIVGSPGHPHPPAAEIAARAIRAALDGTAATDGEG